VDVESSGLVVLDQTVDDRADLNSAGGLSEEDGSGNGVGSGDLVQSWLQDADGGGGTVSSGVRSARGGEVPASTVVSRIGNSDDSLSESSSR